MTVTERVANMLEDDSIGSIDLRYIRANDLVDDSDLSADEKDKLGYLLDNWLDMAKDLEHVLDDIANM